MLEGMMSRSFTQVFLSPSLTHPLSLARSLSFSLSLSLFLSLALSFSRSLSLALSLSLSLSLSLAAYLFMVRRTKACKNKRVTHAPMNPLRTP